MRVMILKEVLEMKAFYKFSFKLQKMVKNLLLVLKKKRKINYNQVRKKVVDRKDGENRSDMYKENEKVKEIWVIMVLVIYTKSYKKRKKNLNLKNILTSSAPAYLLPVSTMYLYD